jgi:uncharacterized protein (DUF1697 family)
MRHLALLRGVNVGGARSLPMRELEEAFMAAGATAAATVIQSGNVVFASDRPEATCAAAAAAVDAKLGFRPQIVLRSATAWRAMVDANPFVAAGVGPEGLHLACLAAEPSSSAARLDPQAFLPDEFVLAGADVYLRLPNGVAKANLTNARLDRVFGTVSTMRNWRTVLRLLERLEARPGGDF